MAEHDTPAQLYTTHEYTHLSGQPPVLTFGYRHRFSDHLTPYLTTRDNDVDSPDCRPGGQRYGSVGLVLPDSRPHVMGAVLEFHSPEDVRQLIARLEQVERRLEEKFFPEDFQVTDVSGVAGEFA